MPERLITQTEKSRFGEKCFKNRVVEKSDLLKITTIVRRRNYFKEINEMEDKSVL